jgi:hypothetical protein
MRKFILAVAIAALGAALLATSASAFDSHFKVLAKQKAGHPVGHHGFRFREVLLDPSNRHNHVGHDHVTCRQKSGHRLKCHAAVHLNGEIGGRGDIKVVGDLGPGDNRLNVVGGTQQFNGVAGKVLAHNVSRKLTKLHFHLVR